MIELSRRGAVAVVTLARPPVNAINEDLIQAFHETLDELDTADDWNVLHIRSEQKVFAAGADLAQIRSWKDADAPGAALSNYIIRLQGLYNRIESLPQVTFCEIGGAAMGGGYELALACDLRMVAEEAKIGLPEVGLGLIPGAGGTQRLTRLCGPGIAKRIILGAEAVDGRTAFSLGMVEWAVPRDQLAGEAEKVTDRLARTIALISDFLDKNAGKCTPTYSQNPIQEADYGNRIANGDFFEASRRGAFHAPAG